MPVFKGVRPFLIYEEWTQVSVDSYGRALIWTSRFEAHIDQIIGLTFKKEKVQQSA